MSPNEVLMIIIWSVVLVGTIVVELETSDLVTIWFTIGAVAALVAAALGVWIVYQFAIFIVVSLVLLFATRPLSKRFMDKEVIRTNADRMIGMHGIVTTEIPFDGKGEVKVNSQVWTAFSTSKTPIIQGTRVVILDIVGNKLLVDVLKEEI
ncbi:membrane protein implicated in regulation of membrane protease activity [Acholeplasma morum]|uniref:NfeD family protein n=1 Tax=Paracholeplasma morum TaxID=264637 RepID=UPI0019569343|nr:NfeD family protein [Paracholeplasma morum]MBM7453496.1 membrane protein implicated in regulation of membrane protease activity [Paracholeplasma morum]